MTTTSKGTIRSMLLSTFCDKINSVSNQVLTKRNSALLDEEIKIFVVLRMNKSDMVFMRKYYGETTKIMLETITVTMEHNNE